MRSGVREQKSETSRPASSDRSGVQSTDRVRKKREGKGGNFLGKEATKKHNRV